MIAVVMGVSGSGKTTIGRAVAEKLGWTFLDGDDFHPPANVAKMAAGTPLTDEDRWPWLDRLNGEARACETRRESAVVACSALKQAYRERLSRGLRDWRLVFLHATFEVLKKRLEERKHRYMPASLLQSQFATLEPPAQAIRIDVAQPQQQCVEMILCALQA